MDPRIFIYTMIGVGIAGALVLEKKLQSKPLSLPILFVALGWAMFSLPLDYGWLHPAFDTQLAVFSEYMTELIVIISLVGLGISIDRKFTWKGWKQVAPLLWFTMPVCIAGVALMGWSWLGLAPAGALLLGACLAPTDPVLARAVQVGPPGESEQDDVRFNLSAEAGFNDSLAFPFIYLAIAMSMQAFDWELFGKWMALDVLWRVFAGCVVGWLIGKGAAWLVFRKSEPGSPPSFIEGREGLLVMAALFIGYGLAEMIEGYGFIAVFLGGVVARQSERRHELHKATHGFIDQVESVTLVVILIFFGGLLASGVLGALTWWSALLSVVFLLILRPLSGVLAMTGSGLPWQSRLAVGFLGIRGLGSIYYLSYGQVKGEFDKLDVLWSAVAFAILLSIVVHGLSAAAIMKHLKVRGIKVGWNSSEAEM